MTKRLYWQRGLSFPEVLVAMAIVLLLIGAIATLVATAFGITRREREQSDTTAEARRVLDRVSDELRGAQNIDWNRNGTIDDYYRNEYWLLSGNPYEMEFYVFDDRLGETVKVRYFLEDTLFKRQVTRLGGASSGCEQEPEPATVVASGIRNLEHDLEDGIEGNEPNKKVFCYLPDEGSLGGCCLRMPIDLPPTVKRIRVNFMVDVDPEQEPSEAVVQTAISPRGGMIDWPLDGSTAQCADCVDNDGDGQVDTAGSGTGLPGEIVGCSNAVDQNETAITYQCDDGEDNDEDLLTDFRANGSGDPQCILSTSEVEDGTACDDDLDNDGDGKIDFGAAAGNDSGCDNALDMSELGTTDCDDGVDNDSDGRVDFGTAPNRDPGCAEPSDDNERGTLQCDNGVNDDSDEGIDYPGDPQCSSVTDGSEL